MKLSLFLLYLPLRNMLPIIALNVILSAYWFGISEFHSAVQSQLFLVTLFPIWVMGIRFGVGRRKMSEFEAALPIAARDLALTKTLAMAIFWLSPIWTAFLVVLILSTIRSFDPSFPARVLSLTLSVSGCVLLASVIYYQARKTQPPRFRLIASNTLVGILSLIGFVLPVAATAIISFVLAVVVGGFFYHRAPVVSEILIPASIQPSRSKIMKSSKMRPFSLNQLFLNRNILTARTGIGFLFVFSLFNMVLTGGDWMGVLTLVLLILVCNSVTWNLEILRLLIHFPISRQRLFAYFVIPPIAALLLGLVIGFFIPAQPDHLLVSFEQRKNAEGVDTIELLVHSNRWKMTTGPTPLIVAPNGSSYRPDAHAIGPFSAYNPYQSDHEPGMETLAFQLSRLLLDCCDLNLTPEQTRSRYLADGDQSTWLHEGLHQRSYPELIYKRKITDLVLYTTLATVASLLLLQSVFYQNRPAAGKIEWCNQQLSRYFSMTLIMGCALWIMFFEAPYHRVVRSEDELAFGWPILNVLKELFANNLLFTVPAAASVIVLLYFMLLRRFLKMELPAPASNSYTATD